jgi:glycosyltransferase involved in cell wall biosynthesis
MTSSEQLEVSFDTPSSTDGAVRPRLLFLNRSYWPDAEASGQLLTELCEDLASDFEITVVAGKPNQHISGIQNISGTARRSWGRERHNAVSILRVPHVNLGKRSLWGRGLGMLTYLAGALLVGLFTPRPAAIVVETDPFLLPLIARFLQWRHRCRLIVYLQDIYPDLAVALGMAREGMVTRILRRSLYSVYRSADRVIVLSDDMRQALAACEIPDDRMIRITNWADTSRIHPIKEQNAFRHRERLDGRFVVMYSGNMGLCQNLDEVLDSVARLRGRSDIEFVLIGDGASRLRLEQAVANRRLSNVRFLPYQPQSELACSLSAADVHLIPLDPRVTGYLMPCKLYGILAAGVPALVFADERSEISRVVLREGVGCVVQPGDSQRLADAISWCADHRRELDDMGQRARQLAELKYDRKIATGRFGRLLKDLLGFDRGNGNQSSAESGVSIGIGAGSPAM